MNKEEFVRICTEEKFDAESTEALWNDPRLNGMNGILTPDMVRGMVTMANLVSGAGVLVDCPDCMALLSVHFIPDVGKLSLKFLKHRT